MMRVLEHLMGITIIVCALWIWVTWFALAYHNWKNKN